MSDIILDEKLYAEKVLSGEVGSDKIKLSEAIKLLSKYYYWCCHLEKDEIVNKLSIYLKKNYSFYNEFRWIKTLEKCASGANKYPMVKIEHIPITESEIEVINSLPYLRLKRILFSMLVCAKYYDIININNNGWINRKDKELFKTAHVQSSIKNQDIMLHELYKMGLIEFSKKINNLNKRITFIDNSSSVVLKIVDFRDLGFEYMNYICEGKFIRCKDCKKLVKINKKDNYTIRCSNCQIEADKLNARTRKQRQRAKI